MKSELLTTGQAAKLYSVTSDTVLKWIRSGRLPSNRTPGGHNRVARQDLLRILGPVPNLPVDVGPKSRQHEIKYCWEFNGNGKVLDGCRECIVYEMRAQRCYQVVERAKELGHNKLFCKGSCEECDYFRLVCQQAANVLVVTDNEVLAASLRSSAQKAGFNLEVTDCEYSCSTLVDAFRPDYAVIDCSLGEQLSRDITDHLVQDPRIPFVRVILVAETGEFPSECNKEVFARIEKPFSAEDIGECICGSGAEFQN